VKEEGDRVHGQRSIALFFSFFFFFPLLSPPCSYREIHSIVAMHLSIIRCCKVRVRVYMFDGWQRGTMLKGRPPHVSCPRKAPCLRACVDQKSMALRASRGGGWMRSPRLPFFRLMREASICRLGMRGQSSRHRIDPTSAWRGGVQETRDKGARPGIGFGQGRSRLSATGAIPC
jgi:hypothetical protein